MVLTSSKFLLSFLLQKFAFRGETWWNKQHHGMMENITNEIDEGNKKDDNDDVNDDDAKWLGVPLEDIPIGKRRRLSRQHSSLSSSNGGMQQNDEKGNPSPPQNPPRQNTNVLLNDDDKVDRFINTKRGFKECLHVESVPAKISNSVPLENVDRNIVSDEMKLICRQVGIVRIYSHQAEAIRRARQGESVVISTPTASGKSLCYIIPILEMIMEEPNARALLMYPLKALANNQAESFQRFIDAAKRAVGGGARQNGLTNHGVDLEKIARLANCQIKVCDGDSDAQEKAQIRAENTNRIIITNPDSLHWMLPQHHLWGKKFFGNLSLIVLDEAHIFHGVMGSNVALLFRRLMRVCNSYGNPTPEFICTSATIRNPSEHVKALTTRDTSSVAESGAPSGEKRFMLWQPAELKATSKGGVEVSTDDREMAEMKTRKSPNHEAAVLIADLAKNGIRCLCFVESRNQCESVKREVRTTLNKDNCSYLSNKIESYRGGYSRAERRELEKRLQSNQICALVCTSALEMGIDVGSLDATVHVGVPETASSLLQQAGRAGRRRGTSLALVIARENPIDAYYCDRYEELFKRPPEEAFIDPQNEALLTLHLPCAAKELVLDLSSTFDTKMFDLSTEEVEKKNEKYAKLNVEEIHAMNEDSTEANERKAVKKYTPFHAALKKLLSTPTNIKPLVFNATTNTLMEQKKYGVNPHSAVMLRGNPFGDGWWLVLKPKEGSSGINYEQLLQNPETKGMLEKRKLLVECVDSDRALMRLYVGGIHQTRDGTYEVKKIDTMKRIAFCEEYARNGLATVPKKTENITILDTSVAENCAVRYNREVFNTRVSLGNVRVEEFVQGYHRYRVTGADSGKSVSQVEFQTPLVCSNYQTKSLWFSLPEDVLNKIPPENVFAAILGVRNVCVELASSIAFCSRKDVSGSFRFSNDPPNSTCVIFIYDCCPNGVGLSDKLFERAEVLLEKAACVVKNCQCERGCPLCICSGRGGGGAAGAKRFVKMMIECMCAV